MLFFFVPEARLELARYCYRGILSPLCIPIPPSGQIEVTAGIEPAYAVLQTAA